MVLFLLLVALLSPTGEAGKIIGGHEAKPHSRPYMAFLQIKISGKSYRCGGFLVREDFVLTAAHCLGSSISVTLGAHNIVDRERTQQVIQVRRAIPHPHYNDKTLANDIMLLQLTRKAEMSDAVSPINLPRSLEKALSYSTVAVPSTHPCDLKPQQPPPKGKIIGAMRPSHTSIPYMAFVEYQVSEDIFSCGGFLVCEDILLTAAHYLGSLINVTWGPTTSQNREDPAGEIIGGTESKPHSCPYMAYLEIVTSREKQLKEKANLTLAVGTLPLPSPVTFMCPGRMCQVAGWGRTGVKEPASSTLQEGDSGGPLLCAAVAQGIVSYGLFSAKPPAVFTWISPYRPWIDEVLKED
ncbi:hypothetical protein MJG53_012821 [Ovis ammon polii x Ovis aries]|uniref:Uncharacterized protein n=1 Tax=Ovis ammon polii x Ovis aries TaxID=2918886 RepID=A0ACB9ULP2_9CETA|nr:hypothetical protein MJG53_012821 [Ovis ammon polii x Ovis aries]